MNSVCVKIYGLNLHRLINKLVESNVFVNDLKIKKNHIVFCIEENSLVKLEKICKSERKRFTIVSKSKFKTLLSLYNRMFGFLLSTIIVFCYLFSFNNFICYVNVECESDEYKKEVVAILKENDISIGTLKSDRSVNEIEELILEKCESIKGCAVDYCGGRLNIVLHLAKKENDVGAKEIYSKHNAIITKINISAGETKVKVGDVVKKGDLLIKSDVNASGEIFGKVCFVATKIYNEKQIIQKETGKFLDNKIFKIRNKILYKQQNINIFSNYIAEKCDFYILDNYFIPMKCEILRYYEVENIEIKIPFAEVENKIKNELYNEAVASVSDLNSIKNVAYSVVEEDGVYKVDCLIECEIDISK